MGMTHLKAVSNNIGLEHKEHYPVMSHLWLDSYLQSKVTCWLSVMVTERVEM